MALTEAESEAAATVTAAFLDEFVGAPEAAAVEAPPVAVSSPAVDDTAAAEEVVEDDLDVVEAPSFEFTPEVPEDVLRELDEADIDDEVERELAARVPDDDDEYGVVEDEAAIRDRLKLQKRNEYLERELAKSKSGSWKDEALKYFPLSKHIVDGIDVTSRRAFLKAAKAEHERILPHVQAYLAEAKGAVDAEKSTARSEGKQAAQAAFGEPLTGPGVTEIEQAAATSALDAARAEAKKTGNLSDLYVKMIREGV